jgi:hypothetical protein
MKGGRVPGERPDYNAALVIELRELMSETRHVVDTHAVRADPFYLSVEEHARILRGVEGNNGIVGKVNQLSRGADRSDAAMAELRELVDKLNTPAPEAVKPTGVQWKLVGDAAIATMALLAFLEMVLG